MTEHSKAWMDGFNAGREDARREALRQAALYIDCNCNELCRFDNSCPKSSVNRILALIDTPGDSE
jgi:hypothetical protein